MGEALRKKHLKRLFIGGGGMDTEEKVEKRCFNGVFRNIISRLGMETCAFWQSFFLVFYGLLDAINRKHIISNWTDDSFNNYF